MLVLVLGDFHLPHRALDIPASFKKLLVPGKIDCILCTGHLLYPDTLTWLRSITPNVHWVKGPLDMIPEDHPHFQLLSLPPHYQIGLLHGDHPWVPQDDLEMMYQWALQANVNMVVASHPSHQSQVSMLHNKLMVFPGSMTLHEPSFIILQLNSTTTTPTTATTTTTTTTKDQTHSVSSHSPSSSSSFLSSDTPSFKDEVQVFVYHEIEGQVKISKKTFTFTNDDDNYENEGN